MGRAGGQASGGADRDFAPTVREIFPPWHVVQEELRSRNDAIAKDSLVPVEETARRALAAQEAANAQWWPTPHGGPQAPAGVPVREIASESSRESAAPPLSFKVYTLAELERLRPGAARARSRSEV